MVFNRTIQKRSSMLQGRLTKLTRKIPSDPVQIHREISLLNIWFSSFSPIT